MKSTLMKAAVCGLALSLGSAPGVVAQSGASEEHAVRAALEHYLAGHATGQGSEFQAVFAPEARLFWMRNGALMTRTSADYIAGAPGRPAPDEAKRTRRITMVDVSGDAAIARIELDYPQAMIVDYMSLLKIDGEWRIINKIFHVQPRDAGQ